MDIPHQFTCWWDFLNYADHAPIPCRKVKKGVSGFPLALIAFYQTIYDYFINDTLLSFKTHNWVF